MTRDLPPRIDPLEVLVDPYPTYARLRRLSPVCRIGPGVWGVTRHADVTALQHDPRLGSEFSVDYHRLSAGDGEASEFFARIMLYRDPPAQLRLRRLVGKAFTPAVVRGLRSYIARLTGELLAPAVARGRFDVVDTLAYPLPVQVICRLMGIPPGEGDEVRRRAVDLGRAFNQMVPHQHRAAADQAVGWLRGFISGLLDQRRERPGEDLLSRLLAAEEGGAVLTHDEIVDNTVFAFFAGFETTVHLLSTGFAALAADAGQQARLRADPGLLPSAVEEFLRYDAPVQGTARLVREPVDIGGRTIRPGRVLVLMLGSANHDEAVFARPEVLDIARSPNPHVTFGGGAHLCLGAYLARVEAEVVFGWLIRHLPSLVLAGEPVRQSGTPFRGFATVPVAVTAAG